jgi:hypothetical protein
MVDMSNYYQRDPSNNIQSGQGQFPKNHVNFSLLLKPLVLIDRIYKLFGSDAFMMSDSILKEFDSNAPYDRYQGTKQELLQLRSFLTSYCSGIDHNPCISSIGRYLLKTMGLDMLKHRKKVLQFYDSNKAFIESNGKFKAPVIITGSGRSGTTLLQRLISEDPNTRSPYTYELEIPLPPLDHKTDPLKDSRIRKSSAGIKTLEKLAPGFMEKFAESHYWSATEMEESFVYALTHNGLNEMNCISAGRNHLIDLVKVEDKRALFQYERLFYTMLDAYSSPISHWTLKSPTYTIYFPLLFEEFQNAKVVLTHRNPLFTLPSLCRLWESWCIAFDKNGSFDKHSFGQFVKMIQDKYLLAPLTFRNRHPEFEDQIFDCIYEELVSDPISIVQKIYKKFDLPYTEEFEERMIIYLKNNQQGKYGRHKYSLEEYGFDKEHLYHEYKEYMDQYGFGIPEKLERPTSYDFLKKRI